jgi:hypothetical protein
MVQEMKKTLKHKRHTICCGLLDACAPYQILEKLACHFGAYDDFDLSHNLGFKT